MFKSVFAKYIFTFMLIILLSFGVIMAVDTITSSITALI